MTRRRGVDPEPRVFFMKVSLSHEAVIRVTVGPDDVEGDEDALTVARDNAIQYMADLAQEGDLLEDAKIEVEQVGEEGDEPLHGAITVVDREHNEYEFDDDDPQGR